MAISKILLIGGITTVVVAGGIGAYLILDKSSNQASSEESLLGDYQALLAEMKDSKTESSLSDSCENPQKFAKQIQALENKLDILRQRKNDLSNEENSEDYIPRPGDQPLDLIEPASDNEGSEDYIPRPGDQPLDLIEPTTLDEINIIEAEIVTELNNLKSVCDEKDKKEEKVISTSCVDACKKYYDCAGYTEGSTRQDQQDAYDGCFEECAKWSDETKICINKQEIKTVTDCSNFSICALGEYSNILD